MRYMKSTFQGQEVVEYLGSYSEGANRVSRVVDVNNAGVVLECTKQGFNDNKIQVGTVRFVPWNNAHLALRSTTKI